MNFLKQSPNKQMICVGDDLKTATWYKLTDKISLEGIKIGDSVNLKFESRGATKYLTSISKGDGQAVAQPVQKTVAKEPVKEEAKTTAPVVTKSVVAKPAVTIDTKFITLGQKIEVGKITAETLIAMGAVITEANIENLIDVVFNKYISKLK